jgi:hypothetical protein
LAPYSGSNFVLKPLYLNGEIVGLSYFAFQRERSKLTVRDLGQDASDISGYPPREYALVEIGEANLDRADLPAIVTASGSRRISLTLLAFGRIVAVTIVLEGPNDAPAAGPICLVSATSWH